MANDTKQPSIAFALGGLGGSNAHAAGFLAAAQDLARDCNPSSEDKFIPLDRLKFISCTSGAIRWTAAYLSGKTLRTEIYNEVENAKLAAQLPRSSFFDPWRAPVLASLVGLPNIFEPTRTAYARHFQERLWGFFDRQSPWFLSVPTSWDEVWDLLLPAQQLVPVFRQETFDEIAEIFNGQKSIGIAFNTFNPQSDTEYLHVNTTALEMIKEYDKGADFGARHKNTVYKEIDSEYVRAALWLLQYGFKEKFGDEHLIDGAYYRDVILKELTFAERIYIPRPINPRWLGRMPRNLLETEDMKIELWFGGGYHRQYRMIEQANEWLEGHKGWQLTRIDGVPDEEAANYTEIDLVEVPVATQRGFFDYFLEDVEVFERAYLDSMQKLIDKEGGCP